MCEPVGRFYPVLVNHQVNVRGAIVVVGGVDSGQLHNAFFVSVPTTTEPGLAAVESTRAARFEAKGGVPAVQTGRVGW